MRLRKAYPENPHSLEEGSVKAIMMVGMAWYVNRGGV